MKSILAVASAKGGVGKSTICCHLGRCFAEKGEKTVIIETDFGLRVVDIFLDIKDIVYDLGDVIKNNCSVENATVKVNDNLFVIPAPLNFDVKFNSENIARIYEYLKKNFDVIIIDVKAGADVALKIKDFVDIFLMVVTTDIVSVRDTAFLAEYIKNGGDNKYNFRLIINKIEKNFAKKSHFKNLDEIIDETNIRLIAAIPLNKDIKIFTQFGKKLKPGSLPKKIFLSLADRLNGKNSNIILR